MGFDCQSLVFPLKRPTRADRTKAEVEFVNIARVNEGCGCVFRAYDDNDEVYLSYLKLVSVVSTLGGKFLYCLLKFERFVSRLMSKSGDFRAVKPQKRFVYFLLNLQ